MDEFNLVVPYSEEGKREVRDLMLIPYHMASLASSKLICGYHQDVNLASHLLSMDATLLDQDRWEYFARISYDKMWSSGRNKMTFEEWLEDFRVRCRESKVEPLSGKALFSTLLPRDMNWKMKNASIRNGILVSGILNKKTTSDDSSSIGMYIYRQYGTELCVQWINTSYILLNYYLKEVGMTLSLSQIVLDSQAKSDVTNIVDNSLDAMGDTPPLTGNSVTDARVESEIMQDASNIRDLVTTRILGNSDPRNQQVVGLVEIAVNPDIKLEFPPELPPNSTETATSITFPGQNGVISINTYLGLITWFDTSVNKEYSFPMHKYPAVSCSLDRDDGLTKTYIRKLPPLKLMIESGARGSSTNAVQLAGIIGPMAYESGRIPNMMDTGCFPEDIDEPSVVATRTLPCYKFGTDNPRSRGFVQSSFVNGVEPDEYMLMCIASRENLASNTDLTPKTGYFQRRMRTFTENLQITRDNDGKQLVTNENGVIISQGYILDPSKVFGLDGKQVFADVKSELRKIRESNTKFLTYVPLPVLSSMDEYVPIYNWLKNIDRRSLIVVVSLELRRKFPDVLDYMEQNGIPIVTNPEDDSWQFTLTEYDTITVVPPLWQGNLQDLRFKSDAPSAITIPGQQKRFGKPIPSEILYWLLTSGSDFQSRPYMIRPRFIKHIPGSSLLESFINSGNIQFL